MPRRNRALIFLAGNRGDFYAVFSLIGHVGGGGGNHRLGEYVKHENFQDTVFQIILPYAIRNGLRHSLKLAGQDSNGTEYISSFSALHISHALPVPPAGRQLRRSALTQDWKCSYQLQPLLLPVPPRPHD